MHMSKIQNNKIIKNVFVILAVFALGVISMPLSASADRAGYVTPYGSTDYAPVSNNNSYNTYQGPSTSAPTSNPLPVINAINPNGSNVGTGTKTITITGKGFIPSSIGRVNGSNRTTTFIDSTHLLMQITGNDTYTYRSNGGFFITVMNGAPGGGNSNAVFFTINSGAVAGATTNSQNNQSNTPNENYTNFTDVYDVKNDPYVNLASNAIFGSDNSIFPSGLIGWVFFAIIVLLIVIIIRRIHGGAERYHAMPLKHD